MRGLLPHVKRFYKMAKPQTKPKTTRASFSVRLNDEEKSALAEAAQSDNREVASLARIILCDWLRAKGFLK
jgi:hypothetical protein